MVHLRVLVYNKWRAITPQNVASLPFAGNPDYAPPYKHTQMLYFTHSKINK